MLEKNPGVFMNPQQPLVQVISSDSLCFVAFLHSIPARILELIAEAAIGTTNGGDNKQLGLHPCRAGGASSFYKIKFYLYLSNVFF